GATIHGVEPRPVSVPSVSVKAVDTSGAGAVHVGASLAGLARGLGWANAVLLGNRAAAYAVSRPGPAAAPTDDHLQEFGASRWRGRSCPFCWSDSYPWRVSEGRRRRWSSAAPHTACREERFRRPCPTFCSSVGRRSSSPWPRSPRRPCSVASAGAAATQPR